MSLVASKKLKKTQVGSLPFKSIDFALDISFKHDLPFIPELIQLEPQDLMLERFKKMNRGIEPSLICQNEFIEMLKVKKCKEAKIQVPGFHNIAHYVEEDLNWDFCLQGVLPWIDRFIFIEKLYVFIDEPASAYSAAHIEDFEKLSFLLKKFYPNITLGLHNCHPDFRYSKALSCFDEFSLHPNAETSEMTSLTHKITAPLCGIGLMDEGEAIEFCKNFLSQSEMAPEV